MRRKITDTFNRVGQHGTKLFEHPHNGTYQKLKLCDFDEKPTIKYDELGRDLYNDIRKTYYTKTIPPEEIGYIQYNLHRGEINLIMVYGYGRKYSQYKNKGLGKQMLRLAMDDIKTHGKSRVVWVGTTQDHPFWSNVWNKSFTYADPVHSSVVYDGYRMTI